MDTIRGDFAAREVVANVTGRWVKMRVGGSSGLTIKAFFSETSCV